MSAAPGWHPQPDGRDRYWDGARWTDEFRPAGQTATPTPLTASALSDRGQKFAFKPWMGYTGAALTAFVLGVAIGGSGDAEAGGEAMASSPSATVTSTVNSTTTATATTTATVTAGPTPTATVTVTTKVTAPPPAPIAAITEGTWTVGSDIKAGSYKLIAPAEGRCYWKISTTGSNGDDIVANDIVSGGRPQVRLKAGQDFETSGCGDWALIK